MLSYTLQLNHFFIYKYVHILVVKNLQAIMSLYF